MKQKKHFVKNYKYYFTKFETLWHLIFESNFSSNFIMKCVRLILKWTYLGMRKQPSYLNLETVVQNFDAYERYRGFSFLAIRLKNTIIPTIKFIPSIEVYIFVFTWNRLFIYLRQLGSQANRFTRFPIINISFRLNKWNALKSATIESKISFQAMHLMRFLNLNI